MATAGSIVVSLLASTGSFETDIERSTKNAERRFKQMERTVDQWAKRLTAGAGAAAAAFTAWAMGMSRSMDATLKMADQIGTTTEALTGLRYAAQQMANVSDGTFDMALRRMTRRIAEAAEGGGAAAKALEELGLNARELSNLSVDQQFLRLADAMQKTERQGSRLRHTMAIFDTEGMPLVNALSQGSAEIQKFVEEAERFGLVVSTDAARAASDFQTEISRLQAMLSGLSVGLANEVLPTLNDFISRATAAATETGGLHDEIKELTGDSALKQWFDAGLVGFARIADVAVFLAKAVGVVGGAFRSVAADAEVAVAAMNKAQIWNWGSEEATQKLQDALTSRNAIVGKFNKDLSDLFTYQGNRFEQAALATINTIRVTSDEIATIDLTIGGDSAGASEEQLKKLAEWMAKLATPTEKLADMLALAKAELGDLYTPEIERRIRAQFAAQRSGTQTLTEAQKAAQAFRREQEQSLRAQYSSISALHDQAQALEDQIAVYGLGKTAIEDLNIARLEEQATILRGFDGSQEAVEAIEREIEARQRLRTAIGSMEQKEAEKANWEAWARDVEQIFDRVGQSLTDAIFDGAKSGKDLLKDVFKGLTFNILINPVMNQMQGWVTNQLGGMFGVQNPAQGGVGILGAAQGASSIYSALTGGLTSGIASAAAGIGNAIGSSALTSFAAGMKGSTLAAGLAGPTTAGATGAMGFGAMAAQALPYIGVGLAALSLLSGSFKGEKRYGGGYEWAPGLDKAYYSAGPSGKPSAEVSDAIGSMIASAANTIEDVFKGIGSTVSVTRLAGSAESSEKGRGGTASGGYLDIAGELVQFGTFGKGTGYGGTSGSLDEMVKNLEVDLYHSIIEAWQAGIGEFPVVLQEMIAGIDPSALTGEQAQAIISQVSQSVQAVNAFKDAVEQLPFTNLRDLSFDAAANLIQFAGSLEALESGMTTYFQNFYSQEEQLAFAAEQMTDAFAGLGLTMPDLSQGADSAKASYRALVESLDVTTEEGQKAYVTLMTLSGGFSELVTGLDELANATARAAEEAARAAEQQQQAAEQAARNEFERLARVGEYQLQAAISQLNAAWSAVQHHAQQEISRLQQTFSQTDSLWNDYQSRVRSLESELGGLLTTISRGVADLRGQVDATAQMQYAQARAVISTALVTGQLPQTADLTEAMRVAQQGVAAGRYGSAFEQREAYLKLAAEMEALQGIAQPELDAAQASLEMLEKQFNRLRGIESVSEMSLSQLERQLAVAFSTEEAARTQIAAIEGQLAWAERQYNALLGIGSGITDLASAFRAFQVAAGAVRDAQSNPVNRDQQYLNAKLDQLRRENPNYGGVDWTTATASDLAAVFRREGMTPEQHYKLHGRYEGLSYDTGTSYVPYDMMANIHQGEIIIDPRSSDILRRYGIGVQGGGNKELERRMESVEGELVKTNQYLYQITKETKRTALNTEDTATAVGAHSQSEDVVVVF